jgi:hypothetical protein
MLEVLVTVKLNPTELTWLRMMYALGVDRGMFDRSSAVGRIHELDVLRQEAQDAAQAQANARRIA